MGIGAWVMLVAGLFPGPAQEQEVPALVTILEEELQYTMEHLALPDGTRPYYVSYTVTEVQAAWVSAELGSLDASESSHFRTLEVDIRVGDYTLDNTHQIRGAGAGAGGFGAAVASASIPVKDDRDAIQHRLWLLTDEVFKAAAKRYQRVVTNQKTKVEEDQKADDFSREEPQTYYGESVPFDVDRTVWEGMARRVSALARTEPLLFSSSVSLAGTVQRRTQVTSEGTRLVTARPLFRATARAFSRAEDGMNLSYSDAFDGTDPASLATEEQLATAFHAVMDQVLALREAPLVEPFTGPAILRNRASGVFFHEIFGHRIEGHRQKDVEEGQTFARKIGESVLPEFLSVLDDPTRRSHDDVHLRGFYRFDAEGVAAQPVTLVDRGLLKNFLLSRSPLEGFPNSNGHGRREPGAPVVARQGNLIVESTHAVPFDELRERLREECRAQDREYGLLFEDITGGFTTTQRSGPQAFKVIPLVVYKVFADGREDQLVRGVDIVGTPLACFAEILVTGDDPGVFNGTCGAESGNVPVAAISPSILVRNIEVEKRRRGQEKLPLLASPLVSDLEDPAGVDEATEGTGPSTELAELQADPVARALFEELERSMTLQMEDLESPYFVQCVVEDSLNLTFVGSYGAVAGEGRDRERRLITQLRVGSYEQDNTNFGYIPAGNRVSLPLDDDVAVLRHSIWLATDDLYKRAVEVLTRKRAYMKDKNLEDRPHDFERRAATVLVEEKKPWDFDDEARQAASRDLVARLSARFIPFERILSSTVTLLVGGGHNYLVNSEGTRLRLESRGTVLTVQAQVQADDGAVLTDSREFFHPDRLPDFETLAAAVDQMAEELSALCDAPILEEYTGPVLFEGLGAAQMFRDLLAPGIVGYVEPVGEQRGTPMGSINLERRLGKSILPDGYQVHDDPLPEELHGHALFGHYTHDDDGVPAERVQVVEDGTLRNLLTCRVPTRKLDTSNGHGRRAMDNPQSQAAVGTLIVEDTEGVPDDTLTQALLEEADAQGMDHALIVRRLKPIGMTGSQTDLMAYFRKLQQGGMALPDPLEVVQVFVEDGREVPVRGIEFGPVSSRLLRDILVSGQVPTVHNYMGVGLMGPLPLATVVAPSVVVEELELSKIQEETDQPPVLKAPRWRGGE